MSIPSLPPSSSPEAIARRHRRIQLGLGIEEDRRAERIAARTSFEEIEAGNRWVLALGAVCTAVGLIALGGYIFRENSSFPVVVSPPPAAVISPVSSSSPRVVTPSVPAAVAYRPVQPAVYSPAVAPPRGPIFAPAPAPDYVERDRRIQSLRQEGTALDDFVRQIRNNPYVSHHAEPGRHVYAAWQYTRGNQLIQERFDPYMKWLDQRRDEVRREKWQLEGR